MSLFGKNPEQELVDMLTKAKDLQREIEKKEVVGLKLSRMGDVHMEKAVNFWKAAKAAANKGDESGRIKNLKEYINSMNIVKAELEKTKKKLEEAIDLIEAEEKDIERSQKDAKKSI